MKCCTEGPLEFGTLHDKVGSCDGVLVFVTFSKLLESMTSGGGHDFPFPVLEIQSPQGNMFCARLLEKLPVLVESSALQHATLILFF